MRAAQQGDAQAFACLWRDLNPAVIRYLRVVSPADAHDLACESWVTAVRRIPAFTGDETSWRELVLGLARQQAADEKARLEWLFESVPLVADDDLDGEMAAFLAGSVDDPAGSDSAEGVEFPLAGPEASRAQLDSAVDALRALPETQAEVLALRLAGGLPATSVAALMDVDVDSVTRDEEEALRALGAESAELSVTLQGPSRPEEVADEAAVLTVFAAVVPPTRSAPREEATTTAPAATVIPLRRAGRLGAGAAAASALVVGIGALSAAAYTGGLPAPVQEVMHRVIGAPAPSEPVAPESAAPSTLPSSTTTPPAGTAVGERSLSGTSATGLRVPSASTPVTAERLALVVLCAAWDTEATRGGAPETAVEMRPLVVAAGSVAGVPAFCASLGTPASTATETAEPSGPETSTPAEPTTPTPPPSSDTTAPTTPVTPEETTTTPPPSTEPTPPPTTTEPVPEPSTQPTPEPAPAPTSGDADRSGGKGQGNGGGRGTAPGQPETSPGRSGGSNGTPSSETADSGTQERTTPGRGKGSSPSGTATEAG